MFFQWALTRPRILPGCVSDGRNCLSSQPVSGENKGEADRLMFSRKYLVYQGENRRFEEPSFVFEKSAQFYKHVGAKVKASFFTKGGEMREIEDYL